MNFEESEQYLLSLGNEVSGMKLGLKSVEILLAALNDPHRRYLKVQVAGTNGKGSVCAFLNAICVEAGISTGMYTSPHLTSITERIQINGAQIAEADFAPLATTVRTAAEDLVAAGRLDSVPTFFEQVTAIALIAFSEAGIDLAILETGLGGRLDATTAVRAEFAAITRIDIDHQKYLGDTIEDIAAEKAAIIHRDSTAIVGEQDPAAMRVILEHCAEVGVTPHLAVDLDLSGGPGAEPVEIGLLGAHQLENAGVAITTARLLSDRFSIRDEDIATGLSKARHPGRLEFIGRFLLDGAHNVSGARALRDFLESEERRPITMIYGAMEDKDVREITALLFPRARRIVLTQASNARSMTGDLLRALAPVSDNSVFVTSSAGEAVSLARRITDDGELIVVTGSLYLVGEVRRILTDGKSAGLEI